MSAADERRLAMNEAVVVGALALAFVNAVPGLLGAWCWYYGGASRAFWVALRIGQACAVLFALAIGVLALSGSSSSEHLFYLYALLPLAVSFVAEQLRVLSAQTVLERRGLPDAQAVGALPQEEQHGLVASIVRREMGVMTLAALVVVFLALRAAATAHGL